MKVLSLLDHASANERHEMLTANEATDAAYISFVTDQVGAISGTPNCPLDERGDGLAMAPKDFSRPLDEQQSVVDSVNARPRIHLVAANYHVGIGLARGFAESFGVFAGNQHRLIVKLDTNRN